MVFNMIDIQNSSDYRKIPIAHVGIKNVKHPLTFIDSNEKKTTVHSVGIFSLFVDLPQEKKGTHMSRLLPGIYKYTPYLSVDNFVTLSQQLKLKLESQNSYVKAEFPFFYKKIAPISKAEGTVDVEVIIEVENINEAINKKLSVIIPIKSLCPCSKAISEYGAHSQRGLISIHVWNSDLSIQDCISFAENAASSPIYSILKREDEKYVTEQAYKTPRFVEDLVRETAFFLKEKSNGTLKFEVTAENFESIHNHNAWACVRSGDI